MRTALVLVLGVLFIAACGRPTERMEASRSRDVVKGIKPPKGSPAITSTVGISRKGVLPFETLCTGTLVADNLIMTAAHCILGHSPAFIFFEDADSSGKGEMRKIQEVLFHPMYQDSQDVDFDIGWLRFEGGLPDGYQPAALLPPTEKLVVGEEVIQAGYGKTAGGKAPPSPTKLQTRTKIAFVGDGRRDQLSFKTKSQNSSICNGDSGGPIYVERSGKWYVAAALSRGDGMMCSKGGATYVHASSFGEWIERTAKVTLDGVVTGSYPFGAGGKGHANLFEHCADFTMTEKEWVRVRDVLRPMGVSCGAILRAGPADSLPLAKNAMLKLIQGPYALFLSDSWPPLLSLTEGQELFKENAEFSTWAVDLSAPLLAEPTIVQLFTRMNAVVSVTLFDPAANTSLKAMDGFSKLNQFDLVGGRAADGSLPVFDGRELLRFKNLKEVNVSSTQVQNISELSRLSLQKLYLRDTDHKRCPLPARKGFTCEIEGTGPIVRSVRDPIPRR